MSRILSAGLSALLSASYNRLLGVIDQGSIMSESTDQLRRKFCENCGSWFGKSFYYDHICEKSSSQRLNVKAKGELS